MNATASTNPTDMEKAVLESLKFSSDGKTLEQIKEQIGSFISVSSWTGMLSSQLTISLSNLEKQGKIIKSGRGSSTRYRLN